MKPGGPRPSLAGQNARLLVSVFLVFELLLASVVVSFLMVPMARRSAADLASLMLLSAQTWSELPPETRPAFERELAKTHLLALRAEPPASGRDEWNGPYLQFLESTLAARIGKTKPLARETIDGEDWLWVALPSGSKEISVGFPLRRVDVHPVLTLVVSSVVGLILALLAARWLAHRTVAPLKCLEQAASRLAKGKTPALLDETGPAELATLAARFNAMATQVRELLAARTTLLAGLSHDLRTPLARMRLAVSLLEERPSAKTLAQLDRDVEEMDRLIGNVLDLARGLQGEPASEVDLCALLRELSAESRFPDRIEVRCTPQSVEAPRLGLRRAVSNLLENALCYSIDKKVEMTLEAVPGAVRIGVLDRGPGIPANQLEAVFEPFCRLDASRSPATGGAGLGLSIVRQLADANGWQIELRARPGGGLEAWLSVPRGV